MRGIMKVFENIKKSRRMELQGTVINGGGREGLISIWVQAVEELPFCLFIRIISENKIKY